MHRIVWEKWEKQRKISNENARSEKFTAARVRWIKKRITIMNDRKGNVIKSALVFRWLLRWFLALLNESEQPFFLALFFSASFCIQSFFFLLLSCLLFYLSISLKHPTKCGCLFYYSCWTRPKSMDGTEKKLNM